MLNQLKCSFALNSHSLVDASLIFPYTIPHMEAKVSEILENILGLLGLECSFEVSEGSEEVEAVIDANNPGRLIGYRGETLDALQLIANQILSRRLILESDGHGKDAFKRVVIDVGGWRKDKEADLERRTRKWAEDVKTRGEIIELEPMPAWQRRVIHVVVSDIDGVESESIGEGLDRHLVIRPVAAGGTKKKTTKKSRI